MLMLLSLAHDVSRHFHTPVQYSPRYDFKVETHKHVILIDRVLHTSKQLEI